MLKFVRYKSMVTKLWVKHNGCQVVKVATGGCDDISDLADVIKKKLAPKLDAYSVDQLTLHPSQMDPPFGPDIPISSLSNAGLSSDSPVFVKTHEYVAPGQKTIYIRNMDEDCQLLDTYTKTTLKSDLAVKELYQSFAQGAGLLKVDDPTTRTTQLHELEDGAKYQVFSLYTSSLLKVQRWQNNEARAMEDEVLLSLKARLVSDLGVEIVEYPRVIKDEFQNDAQEWDGVLFAKKEDKLYLVEAKHSMTNAHLEKLAQKIIDFPLKIQPSLQPEYQASFGTISGVAAGTHFPKDVQENARARGFKVYHVSGRRYVEVNKVKTAVPDFSTD